MTNLPAFYDAAEIGQLAGPDFERAYRAGLDANQPPASADRTRRLLLLIDAQIDFVYPAPVGRLPVPGALDDTRRTIEFLYRNADKLTHIAASLDTHLPSHIFYAGWWRTADGTHPAPYTVITSEQVARGEWTPIMLPEWSIAYVTALETIGRKQLMIWPFHCMEGSTGRALVPALSEAIHYHSGARAAQPTWLVKGTIPETEYYSAIEPEVKIAGRADGGVNTAFLAFITGFDTVYIAGQARSHCVLETLRSILRHVADRPDLIGRLRLLNDCTSSIAGFEAATEAQIEAFAEQGLRLVNATDPID